MQQFPSQTPQRSGGWFFKILILIIAAGAGALYFYFQQSRTGHNSRAYHSSFGESGGGIGQIGGIGKIGRGGRHF